MRVYHGSTVAEPAILRQEMGRDFGFAFYATDIEEQATRWARRKAMLVRRRGEPAVGMLNHYDFNAEGADVALTILRFNGPTLDWLDLVVRCRSDTGFQHGYDIVIGNIANDNVGETVSYVAQGIMRREDALERLRFEKINNQIAFCTERALAHLTFVMCAAVEEACP